MRFQPLLKLFRPRQVADASEESHGAPISSAPRLRALGYWLFISLFGVFGVWSATAPLQSASLAQGVVQVQGQRKGIQHLEGGIVAGIKVANGDVVRYGDALVIIDSTAARAELQILEGRLFGLIATVDRLKAEKDSAAAINFSNPVLDNASDSRAFDAMGREASLFAARQAAQLGEAEVLQQQIAQLNQQITGLSAIKESNELIYDSLSEEIEDLLMLLSEGYVDKQRLRDLERSKNDTLGSIADLSARADGARVAVSETKLKIIQLEKRFKTEVVEDLSIAQQKLYDTQQQHASVLDRVSRATVKSPADGYVMNLQVTTLGAVIRPGELLLEIVPVNNRLVIDARVSTMDIERIEVGQLAEVRMAVFKDAHLMEGRLTKLSADSVIDPVTNMPYYDAEIALSEAALLQLDIDKLELVPGMPVEVLIKTGQRTPLGYVMSPLNRTLSRSLIED
jgi:epimerase transport system membrane fusion protein